VRDIPADSRLSISAVQPQRETVRLEPDRFRGSRTEAAQFIQYYKTITLTPDQERTKHEALASIPAPCCSRFSIATCCCPCNLAKAVWGLSHDLIANQQQDVAGVRQAVQAWLQTVNPGGFSGDACFTRGCQRAFADNGCGGMDERHIS
jgi:hypothetical protein